jgi:transposase
LPIERDLAGPGMLADSIVRRWEDHLPLHRLENICAREGIEPWAYLRDVLCLLPSWPMHRVVDLDRQPRSTCFASAVRRAQRSRR